MIQFSLCGVSLCTITSISLDRFAALHYHMRYVAIVTVRRVAYLWVTMGIGVFTVGILLFEYDHIFCRHIRGHLRLSLDIHNFLHPNFQNRSTASGTDFLPTSGHAKIR